MKRRTLFSLVMTIWLALGAGASPAFAQSESVACTAGSIGAGDAYFPTMGNSGYDVQHYDLSLDLDVASGEINAAIVTIDALALVHLCTFNLDFEGLTIDSISVNEADAAYERHGKELIVTPDTAVRAGTAFTTTVTYHGTPVAAGATRNVGGLPLATPVVADAEAGLGGSDPDEAPVLRGGWFTARNEIFVISEPTGSRFWYPVNEHPADKATYSARYTVPKPFTVVANGSPEDPVDNGSTTTFGWTSRDPMASYLVTLHAGMLETELLEGPHGIPIRLSFAPNVPEAQRESLRKMPEMLAYAESVFGPYPFESLGATVTSTRQGLALETQTLPIYGSLGDSKDAQVDPDALAYFESTMMHEIAHQWFGNSATVQQWGDIWLSEGFASYSQMLWIEYTDGNSARDRALRGLYDDNRIVSQFGVPGNITNASARDVIETLQSWGACLDDECMSEVMNAVGADSEEALTTIPATSALIALEAMGIPPEVFPGVPVLTGDPGGAGLFSGTGVYDRGALTVHALRMEIGDEAFFTTLRTWTDRFANGNATTRDFIVVAESVSGQELDAFFTAWLFEYDLPELDLD